MSIRVRLHSLVALFAALVVVAACSGDSSSPPDSMAAPAATATAPSAASPSPQASATPSAAATAPDGQRILGHVRHLADTIGPRPAGSPADRAAADYIAAQLRSFGYEVNFQEYQVSNEAGRETNVVVRTPSQRTLASLPLARSGSGSVRAVVVAAGLGRPNEFPASVRGNIALVERGELLFGDKVANAQQAGARAIIVYNNEPGTFLGTLNLDASIPAVSVSQADGRALLADVQRGSVEAEVSVAPVGMATSFNVIARPPGRQCETISGGHYDSVPAAPGASDNASGTAAVLEIAMVVATTGRMANHCFVLFGAEEVGLVGSRAFVASLSAADRARLKGVFNYDMVGVGDDGWLLIGSSNLQQRAIDVAAGLGIVVSRGQLPGNSGSDHASFISEGIPALMVHRITDNLLHTPQDVSARVRPELLEQAARLGVALLESLASGG